MLSLEMGERLMPKVIVVGGGFAGIAAATALAEKGIAVELLESRGFLGGRAYSTESPSFPAPLDNGPHLFMGCYHETWRLFERLNCTGSFQAIDPLRLSWLLNGGQKVSLQCAPLPAPFHLIWGLFTTDAFSWKEKFSLTKALMCFSKKPFKISSDIKTIAQFMNLTRQGLRSRELFWIPLCNAVMNVSVDLAPIQGFGEVLHRVFFGSRHDSALVLADKPLSEIGFKKVPVYLENHQGSVHFHDGVQAFKVSTNTFEITTRSGQTYSGDALIWAVPPTSLAALWPLGDWQRINSLSQLGKSPILSVHLIVSQPLIHEQLAGLSGGRFEWVFNRNANWNYQGEGQYLSLVASAAESLGRQSEKELVDLAVQELKDRLPISLTWEVLHAKVTREMAATFIWTAETDNFRLPCETPYPHVFLAGDWTMTGLPATIEGACLSGHRAAEKVKTMFSNHL
jgi:squalene-associated FAD-dependent desaturase